MTHYRLNDKVIHIGTGEECHITEMRRNYNLDHDKVYYVIFAMSANQTLFIGPETDFRLPESNLATQQSLQDLDDFCQYLRNNVDPCLAPGWRHPSTSSTELIDNLKNELAAENPHIAKLAWHLLHIYTRTREDYFAEPLVKAESSKGESSQTVTLSDGTPATVGARVLKVTGEYHIEGTIVAVFHKADGTTPRLVVEHEAKPQGSFLHIYGPANLKALPDEVRDIPAILPVGARVATAFGMGTIAQVLEDHPALPALYRVQLDNGARILVSSRAEGFRAVKENQE